MSFSKDPNGYPPESAGRGNTTAASTRRALEEGKFKTIPESTHVAAGGKYQYTLKKYSTLYPNGVLASPTIPTMVFFTLALAIAPLGHLVFLVGCFLV